MTPRLYIGTAGFSVWYSDDLGETMVRLLSDTGLYSESRIFSLSAHPSSPEELLAGTDQGLHRLNATTRKWQRVRSPMDALPVWSVAQAPHNPDVMLAGTRPATLFRSDDRGRTWRRLDIPFPETCPFVVLPRVTKILFHPENPSLVWAGLEIGGVWRSTDGGEHWEQSSNGLVSDDVHDISIMRNGAATLFATTNNGLHLSADEGASWSLRPLDSPWQYTRVVTPLADTSGIVLLGNGDGPPGSAGRLLRSRDHGTHWEDVGLPGEVRSTLWSIATNPADPKLIFTATSLGQFFRSTDGGEKWSALPRQLGETRSIAWLAH